MFERFTDRARRVVVQAQEEARLLNHSYIGTEHVLLGLITDVDGVCYQALVSHKVNIEAVRQAVVQIVGKGTDAPSTRIPLTPRAKRVLELSLRESLQMGHNYIGSEHILLGLIREGEGVAAQVLTHLGVNLDDLRVTVRELVGINPESGEPVSTFRWQERGRLRSTCQHLPGSLSIEIHDVSNANSEQPTPLKIVICTACGTTIGVLSS
jgi:ATP-dependent Clp protease ATP-binding subunit ClpC